MCLKCSQKLRKFLANMKATNGMEFDEHGVAVIPRDASCRDRGTVTIKLKCTCPKVTNFCFSEADYQSLCG